MRPGSDTVNESVHTMHLLCQDEEGWLLQNAAAAA